MPSFLSITILLLLLSSIHVSSGLSSRRHLALDEQDQDLPKKKTTLIDQDLKSKKKLANSDNSNPKKKVTDEDTPLKPKKKATVVEEDSDLPLTKPKKKKVVAVGEAFKKVEVEEEERSIPPVKPKKKAIEEDSQLIKPMKKPAAEEVKPKKKSIEDDSQLIKPTKKKSVAEEGGSPKLKKMIPESELLTPLTKTTKKVNSDSKNGTVKLTKPKKINSTTLTKPSNSATPNPKKTNTTNKATSKMANSNPREETAMASWFDSDDVTTIPDDLISDFRDLPSRLLPDLSRLSTTSKAYISRANREIAKNVKPYVGHHAAATVASIASAALLALPLLLLTLVFHRVKTYLTLQRLLIFIQAYLAIYFGTLSFIAVVTGLEPLRFFAAASPPSYAVVQTIQTLGYVMYLVVQMLHVAAGGEGRWLGVAQMVVGLAVGVHYYAAVFHRAVAGEPPRANWRVHAVYAGCFMVICACARAERRKKAYLAGGAGDDDGKKS